MQESIFIPKLRNEIKTLKDDIGTLKDKIKTLENVSDKNHINILEKIKYNDDLYFMVKNQIKSNVYRFNIIFFTTILIILFFYLKVCYDILLYG
jgi:hypothetical protein